MKFVLFLTAGLLTAPLAHASVDDGLVGNYRVECSTSDPKTGAGTQATTVELTESQITAGFPIVIATSSSKVGWIDFSSDHGELAVCVTSRK